MLRIPSRSMIRLSDSLLFKIAHNWGYIEQREIIRPSGRYLSVCDVYLAEWKMLTFKRFWAILRATEKWENFMEKKTILHRIEIYNKGEEYMLQMYYWIDTSEAFKPFKGILS